MMKKPRVPVLTEMIHRKASKLRIPLNATFELTPVCNMNCKMCYVRMSKSQQESIRPLRTADEWLKLGETVKENGTLYLLLTGGEPFSHPEIRKIIEGLHHMGFILSMNTNGTMINEETIEWLKKCPPVKLNITIYGASDKTYARLCQNPNGFTQVTHAIKLLKENGFNVKINFSGTPANIDDMEKVFEYCSENNLIVQATSYMFPPVRKGKEHIGHNFRFSPDTAAYYAAKSDYLFLGKEDFTERYNRNELSSLKNDIEEDCHEIEGDVMQCRAGKCSYWITWKGDILPCGLLPLNDVPNVFETDFESCWEIIKKKTAEIRLPSKCKTCSLKAECHTCAAMVYAESGNFSTVPQYRCDMAHAYHEQCKNIMEENQ